MNNSLFFIEPFFEKNMMHLLHDFIPVRPVRDRNAFGLFILELKLASFKEEQHPRGLQRRCDLDAAPL